MNTQPSILDPDGFYEHLLDAHAGLSDHESQLVNAKLVLLLANQLGDSKVLRTCIEAARPDGSPRRQGAYQLKETDK
ncbi:DUF2783 domain-containing protein [Variovorax sp. LjRoot130]|uniref:DUF2783 domain-containing protein n=1 Tax=Variovorax sp. LjRoot130 TaxID=3342261 RepID=UPI003ED06972